MDVWNWRVGAIILWGVLSLAAPRGVRAQTGVPEWSLAPEVRIGAVDGPGALDVVGAILVSPGSGNVYFTDRSQRINIYTPAGQRVGRFGGSGSGPGEFQNLVDLYWVDSQIVAMDSRSSRRIVWFEEDGEHIRTRTIDERGSNSATYLIAPLRQGRFLVKSSRQIPDGNLVRSEDSLVVLNGDAGHAIDRIGNAVTTVGLSTGQRIILPPLWESRVAVAPNGASMVIVHQDPPKGDGASTFRVRSMASDGSERFTRSYRYTPVALPREYIDRRIDAQREILQRLGVPPREVENIARDNLAPYQPPVTEVLIGMDGSIWLQRGNWNEETIWWWVLDSRRNVVGRLRLPARLRIGHIEGDVVWGVDRDELDVNYVVRYRVVR